MLGALGRYSKHITIVSFFERVSKLWFFVILIGSLVLGTTDFSDYVCVICGK